MFICFPGHRVLIQRINKITRRQEIGNTGVHQNDGGIDGQNSDGLVSSSAGGIASQSIGAFGQGGSILGPIGGVRRQGGELFSQFISSGTWTIPVAVAATAGVFRNEIANLLSRLHFTLNLMYTCGMLMSFS